MGRRRKHSPMHAQGDECPIRHGGRAGQMHPHAQKQEQLRMSIAEILEFFWKFSGESVKYESSKNVQKLEKLKPVLLQNGKRKVG